MFSALAPKGPAQLTFRALTGLEEPKSYPDASYARRPHTPLPNEGWQGRKKQPIRRFFAYPVHNTARRSCFPCGKMQLVQWPRSPGCCDNYVRNIHRKYSKYDQAPWKQKPITGLHSRASDITK